MEVGSQQAMRKGEEYWCRKRAREKSIRTKHNQSREKGKEVEDCEKSGNGKEGPEGPRKDQRKAGRRNNEVKGYRSAKVQALGESQSQPLLLGENQRTSLLLFRGPSGVVFKGNFLFDQRNHCLNFPCIGVESSIRTALHGQGAS